jgi:hypothetical protein
MAKFQKALKRGKSRRSQTIRYFMGLQLIGREHWKGKTRLPRSDISRMVDNHSTISLIVSRVKEIIAEDHERWWRS